MIGMKIVIILLVLGISTGVVMAYNEVSDVENQNPYNPLVQAGRYTNYQNFYPDATPMPKWLAEAEVT